MHTIQHTCLPVTPAAALAVATDATPLRHHTCVLAAGEKVHLVHVVLDTRVPVTSVATTGTGRMSYDSLDLSVRRSPEHQVRALYAGVRTDAREGGVPACFAVHVVRAHVLCMCVHLVFRCTSIASTGTGQSIDPPHLAVQYGSEHQGSYKHMCAGDDIHALTVSKAHEAVTTWPSASTRLGCCITHCTCPQDGHWLQGRQL